MKRSNNEIIMALNVIKDVCNEYAGDCRMCPLGGIDGTYCKVISDDSRPSCWKIKSDYETWKAFE